MISYLANRHYHLLTKQLPEQLRAEQPQVVYLPSHNAQITKIEDQNTHSSQFKVKRSRQLIQSTISMGDCCPICFSKDNISVQYYGKKHVCVKCRKLMRDQYGNQIRIFVNQVGEIVCLGIRASEKRQKGNHKVYYYTDYTHLQINGNSAFATFAQPDEMVLILRDLKSKK